MQDAFVGYLRAQAWRVRENVDHVLATRGSKCYESAGREADA